MDQYLSTVIVALITGVFSIITLLISRRQDKVISKIDEQTSFLENEKNLKSQLVSKEKERDLLMHKVLILVLETNMRILRNTEIAEGSSPENDMYEESESLKKKFETLGDEIEELSHQYDLVLKMTSQFQKEIEHLRSGNK